MRKYDIGELEQMFHYAQLWQMIEYFYRIKKLYNDYKLPTFKIPANQDVFPDELHEIFEYEFDNIVRVFTDDAYRKGDRSVLEFRSLQNLYKIGGLIEGYKVHFIDPDNKNLGSDYFTLKINPDFLDQIETDLINKMNKTKWVEVGLSINKYSTPTLKMASETVQLKAMRTGVAFDIIYYCLTKKPNILLQLEDITKALGISNKSNVNEIIKSTIFNQKDKLLNKFIETTSKTILIKNQAEMTLFDFYQFKQKTDN